jgi:hypothetical protein
VAQKGAYTELTYLVEDEAEIQAMAFKTIKAASRFGFIMKEEELYYLERSYEAYMNLLEVFVDDAVRRSEILAAAKTITQQLSQKAGISFEDFRYRSICRLNILEKTVS